MTAIESLTATLTDTVQHHPWLAPLAAFLGGLLTAGNPCVLAMVPLMVGYVVGQDTRSIGRSFLISLAFSIGLTITFAVLFLATWAASSILRASWWTYVSSFICLIMGLHLLGIVSWRLPAPAGVVPGRRGVGGAVLLGLLFGLVSLPCAGPMLLALLAVIPLQGAWIGGLLLVSYSMGHCGLVLAAGASTGLVQKLVDARGWNQGLSVMRRLAGLLIVLVGLFLLFS